MTKQEAIRILEQSCPKRPQNLWSIKRKEAVKMAIEALNFMDEYHQSNMEAYAHDMGVSLEQAERELRVEELSCSENPNRSDLISRQAAIEAAIKATDDWDGGYNITRANMIEKELNDLPSAQPELYCSPQPDLSDDGTLMMTVPHGMLEKVKRVMVDEFSTKFCKVMYQDAGRKKGEWIPVSERLPEDGRWLVTRFDFVTNTCFLDILWYEKGVWWNRQYAGDFAVTAWMPLPESYRGEL